MSETGTVARPVSEAVRRVLPVIEAMTPAERAVVREWLDAMLANPGVTPDEWEAAWDEEVGLRLANAQQRGDDLMPAADFFRHLRERRR